MSKNLKYNEYAQEVLTQLPRGAFLSVKAGDKVNTMTIGWGAIGYMWGKPILLTAIRYSRYTYELIEKSQEFTVSIPIDNDYREALAAAGSCSGRDVDKFSKLKLTAQEGEIIDSPVIGNCGIIYECRIIYKQPMEPQMLDPEIRKKFYADGDYHVLYFGEILACYRNK